MPSGTTLTLQMDKEMSFLKHSALMRILTKVWKTWTGPSQGGRAWSTGVAKSTGTILEAVLKVKD